MGDTIYCASVGHERVEATGEADLAGPRGGWYPYCAGCLASLERAGDQVRRFTVLSDPTVAELTAENAELRAERDEAVAKAGDFRNPVTHAVFQALGYERDQAVAEAERLRDLIGRLYLDRALPRRKLVQRVRETYGAARAAAFKETGETG